MYLKPPIGVSRISPGYTAPAVLTAGPSRLPATPGRANVVESSGPLTMARRTMMRTHRATSAVGREEMEREQEVRIRASLELSAAPPA